MLTSNLACGPMSEEAIEAVFRHSHKYGIQLMLICSRNQIDICTGYVFTTQQYMEYVQQMRRKYPKADVVICRDHCGPGFGEAAAVDEIGLDGVKSTIKCDIENEFDLIHIDVCRAITGQHRSIKAQWLPMSHENKVEKTLELILYAKNLRPDIMFEIGTDENDGVAESDVDKIRSDVMACQRVVHPEFYVVRTGSLVLEHYNAGEFEEDNVRAMHEVLRGLGVKLKEHNADYLTSEQLLARRGIVDAVNIAPQLGVVQTSCILNKALIYGVDIQPFMRTVSTGSKWVKWIDHSKSGQLSLYALVSGHYHIRSREYQELMDKLAAKTSIRENIIDEITRVIEHYLFSLE